MFLKWIRKRSPTRARISGPGISSPSALSRGAFVERLAPVRAVAAVDDGVEDRVLLRDTACP